MSRSSWTALTDEQLLAQCAVDTYRASGPGGQKRNKTSSAVRLRHPPTGLVVIAEESRSQHENRARALRRLRRAIYLLIREPLTPPSPSGATPTPPAMVAAVSSTGRLDVGRKDPRFWPVAGLVLDVLQMVGGRVAEAAAALGISMANLVSFLRTEPKVWEQANLLRARFGRKPRRDG